MPGADPTTVLGVDGTRDGWVAVRARRGAYASIHHHGSITDLARHHPDTAVIAIDIPLWFPTGQQPRAADSAARKLLGPRRSSVFAVPHRDLLAASSYAEANELSKSLWGRGISRQSYALGTKILEVVAFVEDSGDTRFHEVHPEVSFHLLAEHLGLPITASKKTWTGFTERRLLLQSVGLAPPLTDRKDLGRSGTDDVLDACVAAWSAQRIAAGTAKLVGADPPNLTRARETEHLEVIYA